MGSETEAESKPRRRKSKAKAALGAAIQAAAASFTPEAIADVKDTPKRAQMLVALVRAQKLLGEKRGKTAAQDTMAPSRVAMITPLTEAEWEAQNPPKTFTGSGS